MFIDSEVMFMLSLDLSSIIIIITGKYCGYLGVVNIVVTRRTSKANEGRFRSHNIMDIKW